MDGFHDMGSTTLELGRPTLPETVAAKVHARFAELIAEDLTNKFGIEVTPLEVQQMRLTDGVSGGGLATEPYVGRQARPENHRTPRQRAKEGLQAQASNAEVEKIKATLAALDTKDPKYKNRERGLRSVLTRLENWLERHPESSAGDARSAMMSEARTARRKKAAARRRAA